MNKPVDLNEIKSITISGRIGSGASTLAKNVATSLNWQILDGGNLFRKFSKEQNIDLVKTSLRPDQFDLDYEKKIKKILRENSQQIIESHLAGFDALGIEGVLKILVVCEDETGEDKIDIRIDRLINRDHSTAVHAKHEVLERERENLEKWRRLYTKNDLEWVYWDRKYYDYIVNTYSNNPQENLRLVLEEAGLKKEKS